MASATSSADTDTFGFTYVSSPRKKQKLKRKGVHDATVIKASFEELIDSATRDLVESASWSEFCGESMICKNEIRHVLMGPK